MTAYRFTIEGEITAASTSEAYDALAEVITRIAESLESYAPQIVLREETRITMTPLPESGLPAPPEPEDPAGPSTTGNLNSRSADAS